MQTGQILTGNSERQVHYFSEKQIQRNLWRIDNQYKARTVTNRFASSVVSSRRHLVAFRHDQRNWGRFISGRNVKWNGKFPEFPNSYRKGQPREVDRNFRNEFPEIFLEILVEWNAPMEHISSSLISWTVSKCWVSIRSKTQSSIGNNIEILVIVLMTVCKQ